MPSVSLTATSTANVTRPSAAQQGADAAGFGAALGVGLSFLFVLLAAGAVRALCWERAKHVVCRLLGVKAGDYSGEGLYSAGGRSATDALGAIYSETHGPVGAAHRSGSGVPLLRHDPPSAPPME